MNHRRRSTRHASRKPRGRLFESLEPRRLLAAGPNRLLNPGFEAGVAAWFAAGGATISSVATPTHAGSGAAAVAMRTAAADGISQSILDRVAFNQSYAVSAWVRLTAGPSQVVQLSIAQTDDAGTQQFSVDAKTAVSGVWTQLSGVFRGDFHGTLTALTLTISGPGAGASFFVDDLVLAETDDRLSPNLLQNPSLENGAAGWFGIGPSAFTAPTAQPHTGARSAFVANRTAFWNAVGQSIKGVTQPGVTYGVSAWMRLENAATDNVKLTISQTDDAGTQYFSLESKPGASGYWVQLAGEFTLSVTGTLASLMLYAEGPAAGVNFYADDFYFGLFDWRAFANSQIEKFRRRDAVVQVVDPRGQPVEGAVVDVQQLRHDFAFGTAINHAALPNANYATFLKQNFEWGVAEYEAKWDQTERVQGVVNYAAADAITQFAVANGIKLRGHNIFWNVDGVQPAWLPALGGANLQAAMLNRVNSVVDHFKGAYRHWDVNNEMLHGQFFDSRLGPSILPWMFQQARARDPAATLFVNDYNVVAGSETENYIQQIHALIAGGAPVQAIGAQGHFGARVRTFAADQRMAQLASTGLPLWITEYDSLNPDENVRADNLERLYRTAFANPSVQGILMWGFWAGAHWRGADGAIVNLDWTLNEAGRRYQSLLQEWTTSAQGLSDSGGRLAFRGYHGEYRITVTLPGAPAYQQTVSLTPGATVETFVVTISPPTWIVANTNDSGPGSLRNAINAANGTPIENDVIDFRIVGAGVKTISPLSPLPALNRATILNVPQNRSVAIGSSATLTIGGFALIQKTGGGLLKFTGLPTLGRPALIDVAAGELQLAADAGDNLSLRVRDQAVARLLSRVHLSDVLVEDGGLLAASAGGANLAVVSQLTLGPMSRFDLADNDLIVRGPAGLGAAVLAATTAHLATGINGGQWTGARISSSAAAADAAHLKALGVLLNRTAVGAAIYPLFDDEPVAADDVLVKFTSYGDANLDGALDGSDYALADNGFNFGLAGWLNGDFDYDLAVDGDDYALLDNAFNSQPGPLAASAGRPLAALAAGPLGPVELAQPGLAAEPVVTPIPTRDSPTPDRSTAAALGSACPPAAAARTAMFEALVDSARRRARRVDERERVADELGSLAAEALIRCT